MNGDPRYKAILDRMWELHDSKARDYGTDGDPLANLRSGERFGMPAWKRCIVEAESAFFRLENFCNGRNPSLESARNSLMDGAAFCLLGLLFLEEENSSPKSTGVVRLKDRPDVEIDWHKEAEEAMKTMYSGDLPGYFTSWQQLAAKSGYRPPSEEIGNRMAEVLEKAK